MKVYYIGADVHCNNTELAIENKCKIVQRYSVPTTISAISEVLDGIAGKKYLTFEEGPMAGWLYRNLKDKVDELVVCDPRRNKLIASDDDKDDRIDSSKLAGLLRGKFLRSIYHTEDERRLELKRWVGLYHDRVREATKYINRIRAQARLYGVRVPSKCIRDAEQRVEWLSSLANEDLCLRLEVLFVGFDAAIVQKDIAKKKLSELSKEYEVIRNWSELPGVGLIRSVTIFAYLDTPWRFKTKSRLWKYCGVGLLRETSGRDKYGRERVGRLKLTWRSNKRLKNAVVGAAMSVVMLSKDNVFKDYYERLVKNGATRSNARHALARKMLTVMWGMWKSCSEFDVELFG